MKLWRMFVLAAATLPLPASPASAKDAPDGGRWWSHVVFLADDRLEGRDTGSAGHRKAAEYVAREFEKAGLAPAGTHGYLQPVRFRSKQIDEAHSSLSLVKESRVEPLTLGQDAVISLGVDPVAPVEAGMVFAGYGLTIPESGHDDFKDLDVRGKVVVFLSGAPSSVPGPLAAHYQSPGERAKVLRRLGAVGTAGVANPKHMDVPWERMTLSRFMPSMSLADPSMDDSRGLEISIRINPARADKFLAGSGHTFREVLEAANTGKPLPHFAVPARLKAEVAVKRAELESQNVVGVLTGSDPRLKDEYVIFSAHLDHVGVGKPIDGDSIYNGAMDNASGVAAMLDVAALIKETGARPRRSILFLAVTGEEKGLLGSRYFAESPTVARKNIVADVNTDMFLPLYPLRRLIVWGGDESDLGGEASDVAKSLGVSLQADPKPEQNVFVRSDQYSFIRRGIPSLMLGFGFRPGSAEERARDDWFRKRYHAPSDDLNQPLNKKAAGEFDRLVAKLLLRIADRPTRPRWNDTSFFKRFAE